MKAKIGGETDSVRKTNKVAATDSNEENQLELAETKMLNFNKEKRLYGVGYARIMSYYKPTILVIIMLIGACINSF